MNSQWLTMLMSKGIELEQNLRQQVHQSKEELKTQLEKRGIRMNASDFAAMIEEVSPKASHAALSYALDKIRPFSAGMGLRISRLSDFQIELILPARTRNFSDTDTFHEGALTTTAIEAAKILWIRHALVGNFDFSVSRIEADFFKAQAGDCRLRMELPEAHRELILAELREKRTATTECEIKIYDDHEQAVGEIHLNLKLSHIPALT